MNGVHITNHAGLLSVYIKDYHGNIIGKANSSGELRNEPEERTDYDSFGNVWTGNRPDLFGYCGEYLDSESGLIYLRNRYYDSSTGRFITEDPAQDGLNWYAYCGNNPVMYVDPWGLYDREAAVEYALKYAIPNANTIIEFNDGISDKPSIRFNQDCTNFVSFCLRNGGGMKQSDDWYYNWACCDII